MAAKKKAAPGPLGPKWRSRIVGHGRVDPRSLKDHPLNWRVHGENQNRVIRDAIEQIGVISQIIVSKRSGCIIDGHGRKDLAVANEEELVDVVYVDLTPDEERIALATINPMAELAATDPEKLQALLTEVDRKEGPLDGLLQQLEEAAGGAVVRATNKEASRKPGGTGPRVVTRMVLEAPDIAMVERCIATTAIANRGEALLHICRTFLGNQDETRKLDPEPQSSLADQLAQAIGDVAAGDPGDTRGQGPGVRTDVPARAPGRRVRARPDEGRSAGEAAPDVGRLPGQE